MESKSQFVNQFRATFVKTRHSSVFDRDMTVTGDLVFQKPDLFRLKLTGAVNVEILSDGKIVTVLHDGRDQEIYELKGERDSSRFADPLMALLRSVGSGGLRKFAVLSEKVTPDGLDLVLQPSKGSEFELIDNVELSVSPKGEMQDVLVHFKNGDTDKTEFKEWSLITSDDPDLMQVREKLSSLSERYSSSGHRQNSQACGDLRVAANR